MKIITQRDMIKEAPERWKAQYSNKTYWLRKEVNGVYTREDRYNQAMSLDLETCSVEAINDIFNNSWTTLSCNECESYVSDIIQVGQEPDYDSCTADICFPCFETIIKEYKAQNKLTAGE